MSQRAELPRKVRRQWIAPLTILLATAFVPVPADAADTETETEFFRKIAWQAALDRAGISPGLIDGRIGPKTRLATSEFQRVRGLPQTGQLDPGTAKALNVDPNNAVGRYTVTADDLKQIGPAPASWIAKSKLKYLGHESIETVLAEKFHCARHLLSTLNPGKSISNLKPGDRVAVPIVSEPAATPQAAEVHIDLAEKTIRVIDREKKLIALFHCSIAADKAKRPSGETKVTGIADNPTYRFDPRMWPEVKEKVPSPLIIPRGPRNPVGRCWISLGLPGYGMHGTPNPELIGKTGSHGCFRLANWDAIRLGKMVRVGTPVRFFDHPQRNSQPALVRTSAALTP